MKKKITIVCSDKYASNILMSLYTLMVSEEVPAESVFSITVEDKSEEFVPKKDDNPLNPAHAPFSFRDNDSTGLNQWCIPTLVMCNNTGSRPAN